MSVIVKGMEMPKKCGQCKLYHTEYPMYCLAVEGHRTVGAPYGMPRPDWCPLIELPPHGRLADLDKMINDFWDCDSMIIGNYELEKIETVIEGSETE